MDWPTILQILAPGAVGAVLGAVATHAISHYREVRQREANVKRMLVCDISLPYQNKTEIRSDDIMALTPYCIEWPPEWAEYVPEGVESGILAVYICHLTPNGKAYRRYGKRYVYLHLDEAELLAQYFGIPLPDHPGCPEEPTTGPRGLIRREEKD